MESVTEIWNEFGEGGSVTRAPRLRPIHETVIDGWEDYTREEEVSMLMEPLVGLMPREYCLFTPDDYEWGEFEELEDFNRLKTPEEILQFRETLHPPSEHEHVPPKTTEEPTRPERSKPSGKPRAKKRPADLHPQG